MIARLVDERVAGDPGSDHAAVARDVWAQRMPRTEAELEREGLGWFTYHLVADPPSGIPPRTLRDLLDTGWAEARPVVYEDFLPQSAAGIFASNLTADGSMDACRVLPIETRRGSRMPSEGTFSLQRTCTGASRGSP